MGNSEIFLLFFHRQDLVFPQFFYYFNANFFLAYDVIQPLIKWLVQIQTIETSSWALLFF